MRKVNILLLMLLLVFTVSCKKNNYSSESESDVETSYIEEEAYPDGIYCADIDYYNSNTGTRSSYTLNVEVENNEVTVIQWSNGGWLDSTHFSPEELDSDGSCSFRTYDGKDYDIQITGSECSNTDQSRVSSGEYYEKQKVTCPECGWDKYEYDDVCDDCKDKAEHTCKRCGDYDSFMWSSDDLCSSCKRNDEDRRRQEEDNY